MLHAISNYAGLTPLVPNKTKDKMIKKKKHPLLTTPTCHYLFCSPGFCFKVFYMA